MLTVGWKFNMEKVHGRRQLVELCHSDQHSHSLLLLMILKVFYTHFCLNKFNLKLMNLLGEFDMRVKSCAASDGAGHVIKLSDEYGCVLRPKMISKFLKARAPDERATVITYAFFHAFKFPDALSVHIKCKVEICRHGCLDHCQTSGGAGQIENGLGGPGKHEGLLDRKDTVVETPENEHQDNSIGDDDEDEHSHDSFYDDIIHRPKDISPPPVHQHDIESDMEDIESLFMNNKPLKPSYSPQHQQKPQSQSQSQQPPVPKPRQQQQQPLHLPPQPPQKMQAKMEDDKFPHGPRQLQYAQNRLGGMPIAGPRALDLDQLEKEQHLHQHAYRKRTKRSVKVTSRNARSADVGVNGFYDVISEADMQFTPDGKQEPVTVFQGKISEEVVYGICMPVQGFSILFILVISATIIASLLAGSLLYRYQLQKDALEHQQAAHTTPLHGMNTLTNWMTMRLFRMKHPPDMHPSGEPSSSTAASVNGSRQNETRQ